MGIEYVGIASSGRYNDLRDILQKRADRDLSKVFDKGSLEKAVEPSLTLEDAKSVIVCLFPYYCGTAEDAN